MPYKDKEKAKLWDNAAKKKYRQANPLKYKQYELKRNFGISLETYNSMLESQNSCCSICGLHNSKFKRNFAVDHCHITGVIRGLLCINCNQGIGKFKDSPILLSKAIEYLNKIKPDVARYCEIGE